MKSIFMLLMTFLILSSASLINAQIKNARSFSIKLDGTCHTCKRLIENAGYSKRASSIIWNEETRIATITYDFKKTNTPVLLKKLALAGFDNTEYLAPDGAYTKLPQCCQYERIYKRITIKQQNDVLPLNIDTVSIAIHDQNNSPISRLDTLVKIESLDSIPNQIEKSKKNDSIHIVVQNEKPVSKQNQPSTIPKKPSSKKPVDFPHTSKPVTKSIPMQIVFDNYFSLKDMLVLTDGIKAQIQASALVKSIESIDMTKLTNDVHGIWMKVVKELKSDADQISKTKEIDKQRKYFMTLSKNIYSLLKAENQNQTVYYQYCPMANGGKGAYWLSKEQAIKNPYFGAHMMTCGSTKETLK